MADDDDDNPDGPPSPAPPITPEEDIVVEVAAVISDDEVVGVEVPFRHLGGPSFDTLFALFEYVEDVRVLIPVLAPVLVVVGCALVVAVAVTADPLFGFLSEDAEVDAESEKDGYCWLEGLLELEEDIANDEEHSKKLGQGRDICGTMFWCAVRACGALRLRRHTSELAKYVTPNNFHR